VALAPGLASQISALPYERATLKRLSVAGYGDVMQMKEDLPIALPRISSLRDFGGCHLVHGRYLLQATRRRGLTFASMIDINPTPEFIAAARLVETEMAGTRIEIVQADFREVATFIGLAQTETSLVYEVLLHQENYMEVMRQVCAATTRFICIAQPCLREDLFALPSAAALIQFYDDALKDLLRSNSFWPKERHTDRFTTAHWMWGHTTSHLIDMMRGLGWTLRDGRVIDNVSGTYWEYPLLVFEPRA
jgi:hypothetical protein